MSPLLIIALGIFVLFLIKIVLHPKRRETKRENLAKRNTVKVKVWNNLIVPIKVKMHGEEANIDKGRKR